MRFSQWCGLTAAVLTAAILIGCGGGDKGDTKTKGSATTGGGDTKTAKPGGKLEAIEAKETAVLKGRVTFDGSPPAPGSFKAQAQSLEDPDKSHCLKDDKSVTDLTWAVSKDGGVANVAVWVLPGDGKYFKIEKPDVPGEAATDQPNCAFEPRVQIHVPGVTGADKKLVKTGQVFKIKNGAPIAHNTKYVGDSLQNIGGNYNLAPKEEKVLELGNSATDVVAFACDRHKWMKGYVWALPTPFAAVTDKDGNFEIKGIPAGAEIKVVFWHEGPGFFGQGGPKGEPLTLKAGDNMKDAKVK